MVPPIMVGSPDSSAAYTTSQACVCACRPGKATMTLLANSGTSGTRLKTKAVYRRACVLLTADILL